MICDFVRLASRSDGREVQKAIPHAQRAGNRIVHAPVETSRQSRAADTKNLPKLPEVLYFRSVLASPGRCEHDDPSSLAAAVKFPKSQ